MVSWSTVRSLLVFFGPLLLPRILTWIRSVRNRPKSQIKPLPLQTKYALAVLFTSALIAFISTFPIFAPANIFLQTQSRLQTSTGVLMARLAALQPLSSTDERLRVVLDSGLDARLLYLQFGPRVVTECPFVQPGDPDAARIFLFYALPSLLAPHVVHLFVLGAVTSPLLSGREAASWRTLATIAGLLLAAAEVYSLATHDSRLNARSTRWTDLAFPFWTLRVWRGMGIAGLDAVLGWVIFLQSTNRAFVAPRTPSERVAESVRALEALLGKTRGLGVVRNGTVRDRVVRGVVERYWVKEGEVMASVCEEPEVVAAQKSALARLDTVSITRDAQTFVDGVIPAQ
ncbi:Hypothetical protein R9X50_00117100 [Acrodontium crateriforme]|uniref:Uncharacterized protein n=1 Tax=Acrodontium crateriforme TaxID=150365 RepID=A0AAQ3M4L5_9PEZI|nr:Hypothetical protein R9X50_00117100 [Acrodontium crateriforme]